MIQFLTAMKWKTVDEAFGYLESFTNFEKTTPQSVRDFKLDRMALLLSLFDNPHKSFRSIHIAGSKGKGSTGAFLASILRASGEKTGLYASPHVVSYKERMTLAGEHLNDDLLITRIQEIKQVIESDSIAVRFAEEGPTTFELLTLLAFIVFRDVGCSWVVVETGIGGRLDATNVITPAACVLTPVEREHTDILGETIEEIAFEKAGIIKPKVPVFCGYQYEKVAQIFRETAASRGAPCYFLSDYLDGLELSMGEATMVVTYRWKERKHSGPDSTTLSLLGDVQAENSALALLTARYLLEKAAGTFVEKQISEIIREGVKQTALFGRMEIISRNPPVLIDGAHTPASVTRLLEVVNRMFPDEKVLLFGAVTGKDSTTMAKILAPAFSRIIISTPGWFKKSDPEEVFRLFKEYNPATELIADPREAAEKTKEFARGTVPIIVTGSFYMIAEVRKLYVH
jgi:dihydrofolate synthase / folylpolyglutamate synthase